MARASWIRASIGLMVLMGGYDRAGAGDLTGQIPSAAVVVPEPTSWLLGDWGGARTRLKDWGIDFQFGYTGEFAYNAAGGTESRTAYTDQYAAGVTLDLDRLIDLPNAKFQTTFTKRTGHNLSSEADLGTLQQVQEVYGRGQTTRLTDFWFEQSYANGLIDWKVGRIPFGEDFAAFSCDFQNLTFCGSDPGNIVGDYIFNWPISQWATRVKLTLNDFGYLQAGVYDVNPKYLGFDDRLLPVFFQDSTGALIPVEIAWLPRFGDGLRPGSYKIGAWYDTSTADDVVDDVNGDPMALTGLPPRRRDGRYGAYINFEQQLTGNLSAFLNAVVADKRTATTDRQIAAGLIYTGPFSARPEDNIGLAAGTTHVNSRVADVEDLQNLPEQTYEYAFELYYTLRPVDSLLIRPNLQYVYHPGGTSQNDDVIVFGLKASANF